MKLPKHRAYFDPTNPEIAVYMALANPEIAATPPLDKSKNSFYGKKMANPGISHDFMYKSNNSHQNNPEVGVYFFDNYLILL
jgi:hypothetical protein